MLVVKYCIVKMSKIIFSTFIALCGVYWTLISAMLEIDLPDCAGHEGLALLSSRSLT